MMASPASPSKPSLVPSEHHVEAAMSILSAFSRLMHSQQPCHAELKAVRLIWLDTASQTMQHVGRRATPDSLLIHVLHALKVWVGGWVWGGAGV